MVAIQCIWEHHRWPYDEIRNVQEDYLCNQSLKWPLATKYEFIMAKKWSYFWLLTYSQGAATAGNSAYWIWQIFMLDALSDATTRNLYLLPGRDNTISDLLYMWTVLKGIVHFHCFQCHFFYSWIPWDCFAWLTA